MKKQLLFVGVLGVAITGAGCSSAPGTSGQQGAVIGGASGAAVGAAVTKNRALGAVIGGAAGAAGGYAIGKQTGPLDKRGEPAQGSPAPSTSGGATSYPSNTATGVTQTADLNNDGFVTLDEIAKMQQSGLPDDEMVRRIAATGRTFDLNDEQRKFLVDHGVHQTVIDQLPYVNRANSVPGTSVISR